MSGSVIAAETYRKCFVTMRGKSDNIVIAGWVYASNQNGVVHDISGVCQCVSVGRHSGVEPKIKVVYER